MNLKVYIDVRSDLRFIRRLKRDLSEHGRSLESITNQYLETIRPMHDEYVEPSKIHADLFFHEDSSNSQFINLLIRKLQNIQNKLLK